MPEAGNAEPGTVYVGCQLPQSTLPVVGSIGLQVKSLLIVTFSAEWTRRPPRPP